MPRYERLMSICRSDFNLTRVELPQRGLSRRQFLYATALTAGSLAVAGCAAPRARLKSANDKLDVGIIGTGGKGADDAPNFASENIVALCDVDANALAEAGKRWPNARRSSDSCVMLAARKHKVVTQMGNQGHADEGNRQLCEMIWSGAIGPVREVHCWSNRPIWPSGLQRPPGSAPGPARLGWDLGVGPAPMRPFLDKWPDGRTVYHPNFWRGWWDFCCVAVGDMGCHIMDGANWALKL